MFDSKIVAVTGASGGIGRALADMFKANGATVCVSDLSPADRGGQGPWDQALHLRRVVRAERGELY